MKIVHVSDTHITPYGRFREKCFNEMVKKINGIEPDLVIHSGDITQDGLLDEYELAREKLKQIEADLVIIPGNHDARNVGYKLYPDFFGKKHRVKKIKNVKIVALDTTVPDIEGGRLGRTGQDYLRKSVENLPGLINVVAIHHHLIPVPDAGRSRNLIDDAGDVLKLVSENYVDLVLMGHRHVPYITRLENTIMLNAGTLSSVKTRGYHGHSFNLINFYDKSVEIEVVKLLEGKFTVECVKKYKLTD